ncbi:hypothetical protein [Martelella limonii]|nr:hypothetical protein [Martelella limonii]
MRNYKASNGLTCEAVSARYFEAQRNPSVGIGIESAGVGIQ